MFKTLFSRLGNVKAGKFVATQADMESEDYTEEDWENLNDIETVLDSIGIKLRENATTYKETDELLAEIAEKWKTLNDVEKNAVTTAIAGTRQREMLLTMFENWDSVNRYAEIASNSQGTAVEKMKAYGLRNLIEAYQEWIKNNKVEE